MRKQQTPQFNNGSSFPQLTKDYNRSKTHQIPTIGNAGPQSQLKEHACLRMKLKKHSPFCSGGGHAGGTQYGYNLA